MKKITIYALLCVGVLISTYFYSCSKSNNVKPKNSPTTIADGYWFGPFVNTNGAGGNEGALFRGDGTMRVYDFYGQGSLSDTTQAALVANGTYSISGSTIKVQFTYSGVATFNGSGTINTSVSPKTMTITYTSPEQDGGTATFTEQ